MKKWRKSDVAKMVILVPTALAVGALLVSNIKDNYFPSRETPPQERISPALIENMLSDPLETPTNKNIIKLEPAIHHPVFWMRDGKTITSETSNATGAYSNETSRANYAIEGDNIVTRVNYVGGEK